MPNEKGTVQAIGDGEIVVEFDFQPTSLSYKTIDNPHDPGPLSAIPVDQEVVEFVFRPKANVANIWELVLKWKVFGIKTIYWQVTA